MKVSGQLQVSATLSLENQPNIPTVWKMGGTQTASGHYGEEKNLSLLPGNESQLLGLPAHTVVVVPTDQFVRERRER
jgi:hypothetical protein